jgi:hypothetical protein
MLGNLLPILNAIQDIAVIVTLAIVAWQVVLFVRQTKLNTIISYHQYYKDIDITLLQYPKLAKSLLGESEEDEIASLLLGILSLSYKLYKEHLIDRSWWKSDEAVISHVMKQEFMRRHWEQNKHTYNQELVRFIDGKLLELDREKQNSSKVSQPQQPVTSNTNKMSSRDKP